MFSDHQAIPSVEAVLPAMMVTLNERSATNPVSRIRFSQSGVLPAQTRPPDTVPAIPPTLSADRLEKTTAPIFPGTRLGLTLTLAQPDFPLQNEIIDFVNAMEKKQNGKPLHPKKERRETVRNLLLALHTQPSRTLVIRDAAGKLVGCGQIHGFSESPNATLFHIYLDERYRGQKLGRWLMNDLLRFADETARFKRVYLNTSNPVAQKLYESLGFRKHRRNPKTGLTHMVRSRASWLNQKLATLWNRIWHRQDSPG